MVETTTTAARARRLAGMELRELFQGSEANPVLLPAGTEILSWGLNASFQLGDGTRTDRAVPGPAVLPRATTIAAVAGGGRFSLALTGTGLVLAWGQNNHGQLGLGDKFDRDRAVQVPLQLPENQTVTAIAAGLEHSVALTSAGQVYTWGSDAAGQLGVGGDQDSSSPLQVTIPWAKLGLSGDTTITAIAAGGSFTLALTSTHQVLAWGSNYMGQLGNNDDSGQNQPSPVLVDLPDKVTVAAIAAGLEHGLAITSTNSALAWGSNQYGGLGNLSIPSEVDQNSKSVVPVPVDLPEGVTVLALAAGFSFTLAATTDGRMLGWGRNDKGQLGRGPNTPAINPAPVEVPIPDGTSVTDVAAGTFHGLALASTGRLLIWGFNKYGTVDDSAHEVVATPVWAKLPPGVKVRTMDGGIGHTLTVVSPGPKLAWGANDAGQLGNDDSKLADQHVPVDVYVPVHAVFTDLAAGDSHSLAVVETGHVLAWGSNQSDQLGIGPDRPGNHPEPTLVLLHEDVIPVAVAAGTAHSLVLSADGELFVCGRNNYGQLGLGDHDRGNYPTPVRQPLDWLPDKTSSIVAVAASYLQSLVLLSNGQVYGFGFNYYGQLGVGDTKPRYIPERMLLPEGVSVTGIAAGNTFSLILASDGTAYGCGYNAYGQLGIGDNTGQNAQLLQPDRNKPVTIAAGPVPIATIAAGTAHSLAITTDGKALAFGSNHHGELGYGTPSPTAISVVADYVDTSGLNLPAGTTIAALAGGGSHSLAVTSTGLVLAWGDNTRGQLGDPYPRQANRPQPVRQSVGAISSAVAAGQYHSLAR